jgi:DNA-binding HxlR family transcriptional regulator
VTGTAKRDDPVSKALDLVGDRWTLAVLRDLLRGNTRFSELKRSVNGIAANILSDRLQRLERYGIVGRHVYSEHPLRAEYRLTPKGHELGVVAGALAAWGARHLSDEPYLVHDECGEAAAVRYFCNTCDRIIRGAEVRLSR